MGEILTVYFEIPGEGYAQFSLAVNGDFSPDAPIYTSVTFRQCSAFTSLRRVIATVVLVRLISSHLGEPGFRFPAGALPDFHIVGIVTGEFSRESPVSSALVFRRCSMPTSLHPHRLSRPRSDAENFPASLVSSPSVYIHFDVASCSIAISAKPLSLSSPIIQRRYVFGRRRVENECSALAVVIGHDAISNSWKTSGASVARRSQTMTSHILQHVRRERVYSGYYVKGLKYMDAGRIGPSPEKHLAPVSTSDVHITPRIRHLQHSLTLLLPDCYWVTAKRGVAKEQRSNHSSSSSSSSRNEQVLEVYLGTERIREILGALAIGVIIRLRGFHTVIVYLSAVGQHFLVLLLMTVGKPPAPQIGGAPTDCATGGWLNSNKKEEYAAYCWELSRNERGYLRRISLRHLGFSEFPPSYLLAFHIFAGLTQRARGRYGRKPSKNVYKDSYFKATSVSIVSDLDFKLFNQCGAKQGGHCELAGCTTRGGDRRGVTSLGESEKEGGHFSPESRRFKLMGGAGRPDEAEAQASLNVAGDDARQNVIRSGPGSEHNLLPSLMPSAGPALAFRHLAYVPSARVCSLHDAALITPALRLPPSATVAERLACSPPTRAIRVQSPAGSLCIFGKWGFMSGDLPFPPPFHSCTAPYSPQSPPSALKTSMLRAVRISSLPANTENIQPVLARSFHAALCKEYVRTEIHKAPPAHTTVDETQTAKAGRYYRASPVPSHKSVRPSDSVPALVQRLRSYPHPHSLSGTVLELCNRSEYGPMDGRGILKVSSSIRSFNMSTTSMAQSLDKTSDRVCKFKDVFTSKFETRAQRNVRYAVLPRWRVSGLMEQNQCTAGILVSWNQRRASAPGFWGEHRLFTLGVDGTSRGCGRRHAPLNSAACSGINISVSPGRANGMYRRADGRSLRVCEASLDGLNHCVVTLRRASSKEELPFVSADPVLYHATATNSDFPFGCPTIPHPLLLMKHYQRQRVSEEILAAINIEVLKADGGETPPEFKDWGNGRSPRKPAGQRHRPARFPHAKMRGLPRRGSNSICIETCLETRCILGRSTFALLLPLDHISFDTPWATDHADDSHLPNVTFGGCGSTPRKPTRQQRNFDCGSVRNRTQITVERLAARLPGVSAAMQTAVYSVAAEENVVEGPYSKHDDGEKELPFLQCYNYTRRVLVCPLTYVHRPVICYGAPHATGFFLCCRFSNTSGGLPVRLDCELLKSGESVDLRISAADGRSSRASKARVFLAVSSPFIRSRAVLSNQDSAQTVRELHCFRCTAALGPKSYD
ncbi:hypothetical protein PR048_030623 [Dryococelus australis]|uniref:Uncharacterized protein n=1 Tax=Dryococelus australis TaxID=614101 RepID=A0ABQ9G9G1_9NEOP|nr:hypothetical protein PR048_030623 [Dryococelus australis]